MRQIKLALLVMAAVAMSLTSCDKDDENKDKSPNLDFKGGKEYVSADVTVTPGQIFKIGVVASSNTDSEKKLTSVKFTVISNNTEVMSKDSVISTKNYDYDYTFVAPAAVGEAVIRFTVTDKDGENTSKQIRITSKAATTDLAAAADFKWERVGGKAATGLDMFGLKWTKNRSRATHAQIVKDKATKLVDLAPIYTNITTKEALKAAIDAASDMAVYNRVSSSANGTYTDILGVLNGDTYYLINVKEGKVTTASAGTTVTITGDYRK